jgi:hypothetical protein
MNGTLIEDAKNTLQACLDILPSTITFNIIGFGSNHQCLFPNSVALDSKSKKIAENHIKGLKADLGGTVLLAPLEFIYK